MSEIKMYFPGLGGNRYEVSMDELKDLAYKGKIKREDKLIVRETKDGNTTEVIIICNKIKGLEERFASGERDRQKEFERKEAARETAEKLKLAEIQKENERREAERLSEEKRRQEEEQRRQEGLKRYEQQTLEKEGPTVYPKEEYLDKAIEPIKGIANFVMFVGVILGMVVAGFIIEEAGDGEGAIATAVIAFVINLFIFVRVRYILLSLMMIPVRLTQYQTVTIVKAILRAAGKSETSNYPLPDGGVANPSVHNSNQ